MVPNDTLAKALKRELAKVDVTYRTFGFVFTETDAAHAGELDAILRSDLTEFLR